MLSAYREHLNSAVPHPKVRVVLEEILREEEEHGTGENAWLNKLFGSPSGLASSDSRRKWAEIDRKVAGRNLFPIGQFVSRRDAVVKTVEERVTHIIPAA